MSSSVAVDVDGGIAMSMNRCSKIRMKVLLVVIILSRRKFLPLSRQIP